MQKFVLAAAVVCLAGVASAAGGNDPVFGTWKTQPGDDGNFAHVTIADCGGMVCGTLGKAFDGAGTPIPSDKVGRQMIWDMKADGGGKYSGGRIWAPDRDKTYSSRMALTGNSLKVSGCFGPICRSQTWTRVK